MKIRYRVGDQPYNIDPKDEAEFLEKHPEPGTPGSGWRLTSYISEIIPLNNAMGIKIAVNTAVVRAALTAKTGKIHAIAHSATIIPISILIRVSVLL